VKNSKEGKMYYKLKGVFVTVNPEMDTPSKLKEFTEMFDSELIGLRDVSNSSENLLNMLRIFKVPVGLNEDER
jgi:cytochrome oxidase Cu insertion factor (SCO1/SenC/PrrC family)